MPPIYVIRKAIVDISRYAYLPPHIHICTNVCNVNNIFKRLTTTLYYIVLQIQCHPIECTTKKSYKLSLVITAFIQRLKTDKYFQTHFTCAHFNKPIYKILYSQLNSGANVYCTYFGSVCVCVL